jgi:3-isopropylmalate/(R)-2-methylmalate dehydratase small subunit
VIVEGKAVVIPDDDVDTDVMYPGARLNIDDPEEMKPHLFEGYDPSLREQLGGDTVIVTGANFGIGSSREHVPQAMKAWGVRCVVGKSFARIFHRNCVNLGLPIVTCPGASDAAAPGSHVRVDTETGEIDVDGRSFRAGVMHPFTTEMVREGGLVHWARRRVSGEAR